MRMAGLSDNGKGEREGKCQDGTGSTSTLSKSAIGEYSMSMRVATGQMSFVDCASIIHNSRASVDLPSISLHQPLMSLSRDDLQQLAYLEIDGSLHFTLTLYTHSTNSSGRDTVVAITSHTIPSPDDRKGQIIGESRGTHFISIQAKSRTSNPAGRHDLA